MSVLLSKRRESGAEFVNVANKIYVETINFLTRLSSRYSRIFVGPVSQLASDVLTYAEEANSIFPKDMSKKELRAECLTKAHAALNALDVMLCHCYEVMMLNPEGCFSTAKGTKVPCGKAAERLDSMAQELGSFIYKEQNLLKQVMKSDKSR